MAYPCLHSPKTTKGTSSIRRIHRAQYCRLQDIVCEYSGRYQVWSLLQETLIRRIQTLGYAVNLDNSTSNVLIPLDSWTSELLEYKLPLSMQDKHKLPSIRTIENRKWLNKAIDEGPYVFKNFTPDDSQTPRLQTEDDLTGDDLKHYEAEIEAI
ncbi:hypothetical protein Tco_1002571 [Tanacetum coccineum]|uniref:Uncharacterized protein n=1 Tax=Tanacetum coccineum TaxID=301880 RepID=A0ABQ5F6P0_9ASTR